MSSHFNVWLFRLFSLNRTQSYFKSFIIGAVMGDGAVMATGGGASECGLFVWCLNVNPAV